MRNIKSRSHNRKHIECIVCNSKSTCLAINNTLAIVGSVGSDKLSNIAKSSTWPPSTMLTMLASSCQTFKPPTIRHTPSAICLTVALSWSFNHSINSFAEPLSVLSHFCCARVGRQTRERGRGRERGRQTRGPRYKHYCLPTVKLV